MLYVNRTESLPDVITRYTPQSPPLSSQSKNNSFLTELFLALDYYCPMAGSKSGGLVAGE